jgi:toxin FitB
VARIVLDTDVVSLHRAGRLPAGLTVATVWGELAARHSDVGGPRPLHDSRIAACGIEAGLPLLTLNHRDFADFAERDGLVLLTA